MTHTKYDLGSYKLHVINTNKFKTISIEILFKEKLTKENLMKRYFLSELLLYSSKKYRTDRELEIECEELYNLNIGFTTYKSGRYSIFSIKSSFINEKYTEEGMNDKCINFIKDILFDPYIINNGFEEETFERIKRTFLENLNSLKENPAGYSHVKMLEAMNDDLYSLHPFLYIDDINNITKENLYEYYLDILKNNQVDIVICGDIIDNNIINSFKALKLENKIKCEESHLVETSSVRKEYQILKEEYNSNQSKLWISYRLTNLNDFERRYVLNLYSFILGGSSDSLLFKNLREKHSLCYYVSSNYNNLFNILEITAGINSKSFDLSLELINEAMEKIKNGNFDEQAINNGKNIYLSACEEINDSQSSIIRDYVSHEYFNNDLIDDKKKNILKVTKEDIIELSKKIHLDTIYLLKGANEDDKN